MVGSNTAEITRATMKSPAPSKTDTLIQRGFFARSFTIVGYDAGCGRVPGILCVLRLSADASHIASPSISPELCCAKAQRRYWHCLSNECQAHWPRHKPETRIQWENAVMLHFKPTLLRGPSTRAFALAQDDNPLRSVNPPPCKRARTRSDQLPSE